MTGSRSGSEVPPSQRVALDGIGLFLDDAGAYTTVSAAVAMLLVLSLAFFTALAAWHLSRAGDVQASADATALAGSNTVSSYTTAATVLDASILSMGLAGLCVTGVGAVALLVPGAAPVASQTIEAGVRILDARNRFSRSASAGLEKLEGALPYLVAANGARTCAAQGGEAATYTGLAVPVPSTSASSFAALEGEGMNTGRLTAATDELAETADGLAHASEEAARAREKAWLADCGREGANMQERASALSGLTVAENLDYASSITWDPVAGLQRARAYYRWRLGHEEPEGESVEERADSAARRTFYAYAVEVLDDAQIEESEDVCAIDVPLLPRNTDEMRGTPVYTAPQWPTTHEPDGLTLHFDASCPGATGAAGPAAALAAIDGGSARECAVCRFSIGDVGKAPAASTSIDNGFEYHLRAFTLALDAYESARNEEIALEREARAASEGAGYAFEEALSSLSAARPRIAPPGRNGCLGFAVTGGAASPSALASNFAAEPASEARGAVAAAVLAPEGATGEANVLGSFFSGLQERCGEEGAAGLIDSVMDLWGRLLVSYGDIASGASEVMDGLLGGLEGLGVGALSQWLGDRLSSCVEMLGVEPVDLRLKKPVLTNTANVLASGGWEGASGVQDVLRSLPIGTTDPGALLEAAGYEAGERIASAEITLAEIPIPGSSSSIPLTVRLGDLL